MSYRYIYFIIYIMISSVGVLGALLKLDPLILGAAYRMPPPRRTDRGTRATAWGAWQRARQGADEPPGESPRG